MVEVEGGKTPNERFVCFFPMKQFSTRFDLICFLRQTANPHVEQNHNIYQQNAEPSL